MSAAPLLPLRQAIVAHLKDDPIVTTKLPAEDQYGERVPKDRRWPYSRYGEADASPGHLIAFPIHVHSKAGFTDEVAAIMALIGDSLDGIALELEDGTMAHLALAGTRIIGDPDEADAWHGIVSMRATIARDCDER